MKATKSMKRKLPRPFKMPWGKGMIVEEAGYIGQWHEPSLQLMEYDNGALSIRFCYYSNGVFQRAPLMIGVKELKRLRASLAGAPRLKQLLKELAR